METCVPEGRPIDLFVGIVGTDEGEHADEEKAWIVSEGVQYLQAIPALTGAHYRGFQPVIPLQAWAGVQLCGNLTAWHMHVHANCFLLLYKSPV